MHFERAQKNIFDDRNYVNYLQFLIIHRFDQVIEKLFSDIRDSVVQTAF